MFAFIVALGIVVDDAIVAGENIYEYRQRGYSYAKAAIIGARTVLVPITFAILTNIVAFLPLYFVPGFMGKIWKAIPIVVITVFIISWVEALLILPCHLAHTRSAPASPTDGTPAQLATGVQCRPVRFHRNIAIALRLNCASDGGGRPSPSACAS